MPQARQHKGIFCCLDLSQQKRKCPKPERLSRRAEKLATGGLKVTEMNWAGTCPGTNL